jgi:hypothetical protein
MECLEGKLHGVSRKELKLLILTTQLLDGNGAAKITLSAARHAGRISIMGESTDLSPQ